MVCEVSSFPTWFSILCVDVSQVTSVRLNRNHDIGDSGVAVREAHGTVPLIAVQMAIPRIRAVKSRPVTEINQKNQPEPAPMQGAVLPLQKHQGGQGKESSGS